MRTVGSDGGWGSGVRHLAASLVVATALVAPMVAAAVLAAPARAGPLETIVRHWDDGIGTLPRFSGCGHAPPLPPPAQVEVGDEARDVIVRVPEGYDPLRAHPLILAFHGRTAENATARRYFGLEPAAPSAIFAYPAGRRDASGRFTWFDTTDPGHALRDYALFDAVVATLTRHYCVDGSRIFAVGHSLGATFVNNLACARGHVLRAVATLAGGISPFACRGEVAAMLLHNPNDRLVGIRHGLHAREVLLARNDLVPMRRTVTVGSFACRRYGAPREAHPVLWCPHRRDHTRTGRYYPHQWPAGTGEAMMAFFASLPVAAQATVTGARP